jgi:hypothetical protein
MTGDRLWQCEKWCGPRQAIQAFAGSFWPSPRKVRALGEDGRTFTMTGGSGRVYRLEEAPGPVGPCWVVVVAEEGRA